MVVILQMRKCVSSFHKQNACLSSLPQHGRPLMPFCSIGPCSHPAKRMIVARAFLIYKSQKDQFNIHEQSVPAQAAISVTVGQYDDRASQRKRLCLPHCEMKYTI